MIPEIFKNAPSRVKLAMVCLSFFVVTAITAPIIANDQPLYLKIEGKSYYPIFSGLSTLVLSNGKRIAIDYPSLINLETPPEAVIWPMVPFLPNRVSIKGESYPEPGTVVDGRRHWLGANGVGEDVLSGLIYGARVSLQVGFFSMLISLVIGLLVGLVSGYWGNNHLRLPTGRLIALALGLPLAWFYSFSIRKYLLLDALSESLLMFGLQGLISFAIFFSVLALAWYLSKFIGAKVLKRVVAVPLDHITNRFMELFMAIPVLVIFISISSLMQPSIYLLIMIIGLTAWIGIARYTRAEVFRIRQTDFIHSCQLSGMGTLRILIRHLLPNAIGPALVAFTFGVGAAIVSEATLSFLNIGIPKDVVTWGKLLAQARSNFDAWWLVWFPGLMIFVLVLCVNILGEYLKKRLNPVTA